MTALRKEGLEYTIVVNEYFFNVYWKLQIISQWDISSSVRKEKSLVVSLSKHFKKIRYLIWLWHLIESLRSLALDSDKKTLLFFPPPNYLLCRAQPYYLEHYKPNQKGSYILSIDIDSIIKDYRNLIKIITWSTLLLWKMTQFIPKLVSQRNRDSSAYEALRSQDRMRSDMITV